MSKPLPPKPSVAVPPFNDITRHNLENMRLAIQHVLDRAHHIAFDCEFTGLGNDPKTRDSDLAVRYKALAEVARTHAIVSFGLTVFEAKPAAQSEEEADPKEQAYVVHNFNFIMLAQHQYVVAPRSMLFLVDNGFDFNRQFKDGIWYTPGDDPPITKDLTSGDTNQAMRQIFKHIISRRVPIVVHNGLLDMCFIYHSFYATLPNSLDMFLSDLDEMFPGGIYDTKYVADYVTRETKSFLAYLFRKYEREQLARSLTKETRYITCETKDRMPTINSTWVPPPSKKRSFPDSGKPYCEQYAAHGFCNRGRYCTKSHDLDIILDEELGAPESKRRKRGNRNPSVEENQEAVTVAPNGNGSHVDEDKTDTASTPETASLPKNPDTPSSTPDTPVAIPSTTPESSQPPPPSDGTLFEKYHSACFDAYMTGFIFARQLIEHGRDESSRQELRNKMYLMHKSIPLTVQKSSYAKCSKAHREKMARMRIEGFFGTALTGENSGGGA